MKESIKCRLMLDFNSEEALADFLDEFMPVLRKHIEFEPAVYRSDGLDYSPTHGGIGRKHSYIIKADDDKGRFDDRFEVTRKVKY